MIKVRIELKVTVISWRIRRQGFMLSLIKYLYYKLCVLLDNIKKDVHYQVTRPEYNKLTFTYRTIPKIGRIAIAVV